MFSFSKTSSPRKFSLYVHSCFLCTHFVFSRQQWWCYNYNHTYILSKQNRGAQNKFYFYFKTCFIIVLKRNETICEFGTYMVYCLPGYEEGFFAFTIQNFVVILGKRMIFGYHEYYICIGTD